MLRRKKESIKGITALVVFLALIVAVSYIFPHSTEQAGYTVIGIGRLEEDPLPLEGANVSSSATILSVHDNGSVFVVGIGEETELIFRPPLQPPEVGERILFRGTSWVATNGSIVVHQFNAIDPNSSLIRSVPGILLFALLFFITYTVDTGGLAFIRRGE